MSTVLVLALLLSIPIALMGGKTLWTRRVCRRKGHRWQSDDDGHGWVCSRCGHYI